jgi:hypothetical protein
MAATPTIKAYGLELTPEQWSMQPICRCSSDELREFIRQGVPPEVAIVTPSRMKRRFRGVSFHKSINRWIAQIKVDGKVKFLGSFENDVDAASAFDAAAKALGRETNF